MRIDYEAPTAVAVDWGIVKDGRGGDVSFEEARWLHRTLKFSPCITLTVRFLTTQTITVRCAPADTIAKVKARILERLQHFTGKEPVNESE